jgi:hypothetical protein
MNTKIVMIGSAVFMGTLGIALTFLSSEVAGYLEFQAPGTVLLLQILGALCFGFAMLNWMSKESVIGGIYSRPLVLANLSHYFIGAMAFINRWGQQDLRDFTWVLTGLYAVFAILFGLLLFQHPAAKNKT